MKRIFSCLLFIVFAPMAQASEYQFVHSGSLLAHSTVCPAFYPEAVHSGQSVDYMIYEVDETWQKKDMLPALNEYLSFRSWVEGQVEPEPYSLLERQRGIFANAYGNDSSYVRQFDLIINRYVGSIRNISCLEANLFDQHLVSSDIHKTRKSEFSAWIFKKGSRLKVIVGLSHDPWIGAPSLENADQWFNKMKSSDWQFYAFLHNHPFAFRNSYGDIAGTTIPSSPDLRSFKNYFENRSMDLAIITNGFSSIELTRDDVLQLSATLD